MQHFTSHMWQSDVSGAMTCIIIMLPGVIKTCLEVRCTLRLSGDQKTVHWHAVQDKRKGHNSESPLL